MKEKVISLNTYRPVTKESLAAAIQRLNEQAGNKCHICGSDERDIACIVCGKACCSKHHQGFICNKCQSDEN